jgi:hypothetical protein
MKTRRCIEIRTFRRRTTVIRGDKPAGGPVGLPPHHADTSHTVAAGSPRTERSEPERPQIKQLPQGGLRESVGEHHLAASEPEAD